ncbi:hypothetical protein [Nocardioides marmoraquaticus]
MEKVLISLIPTAVTLAIGLLTVLALPWLGKLRSLRRDLEQDAAVVDKLPRGAQGALRRDMADRAHVVVAYSRHPAATYLDVLATLVVVVLAAITCTQAIAQTLLDKVYAEAAFTASVFFVMQASIIALTITRWQQRALDRLQYLESCVPQDVAHQYFRSTALGYGVIRFLALLLTAGPLVWTVWVTAVGIYERSGWGDLLALLTAPILLTFGGGVAIRRTLWNRPFARVLQRGGDVLGSYTPMGVAGGLALLRQSREDTDDGRDRNH